MQKQKFNSKKVKENIEVFKISSKEDLKSVFDAYYVELCIFARKYVYRKDIAEELVQDVMVHLWEKKEDIDFYTSLKSYLYKATKNKAINYLKSMKENNGSLMCYDEESYNQFDEEHNRNELGILLQKAIQSLPRKCQTVFNLNKFGGLTYREISEDLNISEKTVENQMGNALKKIRNFMKDYGYFLIIIFLH